MHDVYSLPGIGLFFFRYVHGISLSPTLNGGGTGSENLN